MPEDPIVAALLQAADALTTGDRPRADASMERIAFRPQPNRPTSVNPGRNDGRGVRAPHGPRRRPPLLQRPMARGLPLAAELAQRRDAPGPLDAHKPWLRAWSHDY